MAKPRLFCPSHNRPSHLFFSKKEESFLSSPNTHHYIDIFDSPKTRLAANYLSILCLVLGCAMCMSNICAVKIWQIGPIILDGGFFLFPITYVITDVLVELFYRKYANRVITWCCLVNLGCFAVLQLTSWLPAAPGTDQIDIASALGLSGRVFLASVVATFVSSRVNNLLYDYLRPYTNGKQGICLRAWASSFLAHIPDSVIFTVLAFANRQSTLQGLCQQSVTSYLSAFAVETALMPLTVAISVHLLTKIRQAK